MKKLLCTLLLSVIFTGTYTAVAQTPSAPSNLTKADSTMITAYNRVQNNKEIVTSGPVYEEYYNKFKELELKRLNSYSHKKFRKLHKVFIKKINYKGQLAEISDDVLGYIKTNLQFTDFESYEEAEKEWAEIMQASKESIDENHEYFAFLFETIEVCGHEIVAKVMLEIIKENPELN